MNDSQTSYCLPPVTRADTSLLILGSLPGVRSLELSQYYGHPRNHFWRLLGHLITVDMPSLPYQDRLHHMQRAGIGLWDVVAHAVRPGSLDQHMRDILPNSLIDCIEQLPALRAIAFNGATAGKIGRRQLADYQPRTGYTLELIDLPSSSPANTLSQDHKQAAWDRLRPFIRADSL